MNLPLSYKSFMQNIYRIEMRYPETANEVLLLGFYELILQNIVTIENKDMEEFYISIKNKPQNNFYNLLCLPIENKSMSLKSYITRIGIYGYYLSNVFSKRSIKKVLVDELKTMGILKSKYLLFYVKYIIRDDINEVLESTDFNYEKEKLIQSVKTILNYNENTFLKFTEIVSIYLGRSVHTAGWGIQSLGR